MTSPLMPTTSRIGMTSLNAQAGKAKLSKNIWVLTADAWNTVNDWSCDLNPWNLPFCNYRLGCVFLIFQTSKANCQTSRQPHLSPRPSGWLTVVPEVVLFAFWLEGQKIQTPSHQVYTSSCPGRSLGCSPTVVSGKEVYCHSNGAPWIRESCSSPYLLAHQSHCPLHRPLRICPSLRGSPRLKGRCSFPKVMSSGLGPTTKLARTQCYHSFSSPPPVSLYL